MQALISLDKARQVMQGTDGTLTNVGQHDQIKYASYATLELRNLVGMGIALQRLGQ